MIVVSDTSPVTYLIQAGHLSLLRELFSEGIIPTEIFRELQAAPVNFPSLTVEMDEGWIQVQSPSEQLPFTLSKDLDAGEAEAIALALEMGADLVLMDEHHGTLIARKLNLRVFGLLAVLVEAKQKGLITTAKPLLDKLIQSGFRVSPNLYKQILLQVNE
jgi:predicted nucleic acid-binding protein